MIVWQTGEKRQNAFVASPNFIPDSRSEKKKFMELEN
jgi:hypothetical protein